MPPPVTIRLYEEGDAESVAALMDDFRDFLVGIDPNKRFRRMPGFGEYALKEEIENVKEGQGAFYVAVDVEKIVGFCIGFILKDFREKDLLGVFPAKRGRIEELYIVPEYRKQGIGTLLMAKTEEFLKSKGCSYLLVGVHAFNQNAHELYKRLGYSDVGIDLFKRL